MITPESKPLISKTPDQLCKAIGSLYLQQEFSDVVLIINEERIYAHKAILCTRSQYFKKALAKDDVKELTLKGQVDAHKKLLSYFYTGSMLLDSQTITEDIELLRLLPEYQIHDLEEQIYKRIKLVLNPENVFKVLVLSDKYDIEKLVERCYQFLDGMALEMQNHDGLYKLDQKILANLLKRDTFLLPEINIFNIAIRWRKTNDDIDDLVLNCVRFDQMSVTEVMTQVQPVGAVDSEKILSMLADIFESASDPEARAKRMRMQLERDTNLATLSNGTKVSKLNGAMKPYRHNHSSCPIGNTDGTVIKLGRLFWINNIKFTLNTTGNRHYKYYVEVSQDKLKWTTVIDYTQYGCRSEQDLYFESVPVRYIRVVGTYNSSPANFRFRQFQVSYSSYVPALYKSIIIPRKNVALVDKGAVVMEGVCGNNLINGDFEDYSISHGFTYHHITGYSSIKIQLNQPYYISKIKMLLFDREERVYKYYIETSSNDVDWQMAIDHRNIESRSWQEEAFSPRIAVYIRLTGTSNPTNLRFTCVHFECYYRDPGESEDDVILETNAAQKNKTRKGTKASAPGKSSTPELGIAVQDIGKSEDGNNEDSNVPQSTSRTSEVISPSEDNANTGLAIQDESSEDSNVFESIKTSEDTDSFESSEDPNNVAQSLRTEEVISPSTDIPPSKLETAEEAIGSSEDPDTL